MKRDTEESKISSSSTNYDSKWVNQHALSKISEVDFEDIVDDLEDNNKITKQETRTIRRQFKELRVLVEQRAS